MTTEQIRQFVRGDEERIVELFNQIFRTNRPMKRWNWQFADNPMGASYIALAESDGELVGQYCVMRQQLNFGGRQVHAAQSCDTMVRSDQQGKRWFVRLAEACYADGSAQGMKVVFGFPNRNSFPGFVRSLGWHRIASLPEYHCRTSITDFAGRIGGLPFALLLRLRLRFREMLLRRNVKGGRVVTSDEIPESVASLLDETRNYEILSIWKDLSYMKWRYQQHPEHRYVYHVLYVGDSADGLIVVRDSGKSAAVCELIHRKKDVSQAAYLLNAAVRHHASGMVQTINFHGHDDGFFHSVFRRCGFGVSYSNSFIFSGRVFGDSELERRFLMPQNWTVVLGDTDVA